MGRNVLKIGMVYLELSKEDKICTLWDMHTSYINHSTCLHPTARRPPAQHLSFDSQMSSEDGPAIISNIYTSWNPRQQIPLRNSNHNDLFTSSS